MWPRNDLAATDISRIEDALTKLCHHISRYSCSFYCYAGIKYYGDMVISREPGRTLSAVFDV